MHSTALPGDGEGKLRCSPPRRSAAWPTPPPATRRAEDRAGSHHLPGPGDGEAGVADGEDRLFAMKETFVPLALAGRAPSPVTRPARRQRRIRKPHDFPSARSPPDESHLARRSAIVAYSISSPYLLRRLAIRTRLARRKSPLPRRWLPVKVTASAVSLNVEDVAASSRFCTSISGLPG